MFLRNSSLLSLLVGALLLGGCATSEADITSSYPVEYRHPITVEPQIAELEIAPDAAEGVSPRDRAVLATFLRGFRENGNGRLTVSSPADGRDLRAASKTMGYVLEMAAAEGITRDRIALGSYGAAGGMGLVKLSYTAYVARGPECGNFSEDLASTPGNNPTPNFGCASQANLAAMIGDPRDLIDPRAMDPADAARRDTVLGEYRRGESTASDRSESESGQVSEVGGGGQ
ncbi:MAG TPA: CpaD family pilus assembly protein [Micropepsaceae bacterium]|nr:CpaD family pilus assembly protein [Micropepsaceae bacterium]